MKEKNINCKGDLELSFSVKWFTSCPLPLKTSKQKTVDIKNNREKKDTEKIIYKSLYKKTTGNYELQIIGNEEVGYPYGTDNLIILYLNNKAIANNSKKFTITLTDFLEYYNFDKSGRNYKNFKKGFERIFYSTFYFAQKQQNNEKKKELSFRIIQAWKNNFGEKNDELLQGEIMLTDFYFNLIKKQKTPYDLNVLKEIKKSPVKTNLYIFFIYRLYVNFKIEKREVFIPFFGENSLQKQLSINIESNKDFRKFIKKNIEFLQKYWDMPPFYLKKEIKEKNFIKRRPKEIDDGVYIYVKDESQLNIPLHKEKDTRIDFLKNEQAKIHFKPCPICKGQLVVYKGKHLVDGKRMDNYLRCLNCKDNFYTYNYPDLFKDDLYKQHIIELEQKNEKIEKEFNDIDSVKNREISLMIREKNMKETEKKKEIPQYIKDMIHNLEEQIKSFNILKDEGGSEKLIKSINELEKLKKQFSLD